MAGISTTTRSGPRAVPKTADAFRTEPIEPGSPLPTSGSRGGPSLTSRVESAGSGATLLPSMHIGMTELSVRSHQGRGHIETRIGSCCPKLMGVDVLQQEHCEVVAEVTAGHMCPDAGQERVESLIEGTLSQ